jgi:hypothetical protein
MPELDPTVAAWVDDLVNAVDNDNTIDGLKCENGATRWLLRVAPKEMGEQVRLALEDLDRTADRPLAALRSDSVAQRFAPTPLAGGLNVLVARMTVPGGPWPGHFGLETVVFRSRPAVMPAACPPTRKGVGLHFGQLVAASRGYRDGAGTVLFPEQLSVDVRPGHQAFGVVFLDRLHQLFRARVLPVLATSTFAPAEVRTLFELRGRAFLAHERGHLQGADLEAAVLTRRRRLAAVVSELHADLDALVMLLDSPDPMARAAAKVLAADRIIREAWLKRSYAQVDAIAARHLLVLLAKAGAVTLDGGRLSLDLAVARHRLDEEVHRVRELERSCCTNGLEPARQYLRDAGWAVVDSACHRELESPIARFLGYAASRSVPVPA